MTHKVVIKCTKCLKSYPYPPTRQMWTFINVELKEVECPACGGTAFSIMEVPDHG